MKRSEMLWLILHHCYPETNTTGTQGQGFKRKKHFCNELLSKIEKAGMLPPFNSKISTHPQYPLDAFEWEPEDE